MNQSNHQEYYVVRAAASRDLEQRAKNPAIAAIHAEFATRYEQLAGQPGRNDEIMLTAVQPA